jgi:hypothetical protein
MISKVTVMKSLCRLLFLPMVALFSATAFSLPADALGTARIQQKDGSVKVYKNVSIRVKDQAMALVSSDGQGMLILGKAACTKVDELIRCLPYDATLQQHGKTFHIALKSGTVWINPTSADQPLSYSSTRLPPRGVLLSIQTKGGTYVSLSGTIDEVQK